jgi:uncharacterized membrane protein
MDPAMLSDVLRNGDSLFLANRRGIVGLALVSSFAMAIVALFQMGMIRHVPEPTLPWLDADRVDAAPEAYGRMFLPVPDALLGLLSYAITAVLAGIGGADRAGKMPWVPLLLMLKVSFDAVQAGRLTWEQWAVHRAFCSWCVLAASATVITVPLAWPEAWAAFKAWSGIGSFVAAR